MKKWAMSDCEEKSGAQQGKTDVRYALRAVGRALRMSSCQSSSAPKLRDVEREVDVRVLARFRGEFGW